MLILVSWWCVIWIAESAVLEPALYLMPSPPMYGKYPPFTEKKRVERKADELSVVPLQYEKITYGAIHTTTLSPLRIPSTSPAHVISTNISPTRSDLSTHDSRISITHIPPSSTLSSPEIKTTTLHPTMTTKTKEELMEKSETFWPSFRTSIPYIHVPLSFRLSGTYGYADPTLSSGGNAGIISTSYISTPNRDAIQKLYGNSGFGKSGLAGSSYGSYSGFGTRIFANPTGSSWSGWGNGKWGHYGKG